MLASFSLAQTKKKVVQIALLFSFLTITSVTYAQKIDKQEDTAYTRVVNQRAEKIVTTLNIKKAKQALKVRDIIARQYKDLNTLHSSRDARIKEIKSQVSDKAAAEQAIQKVRDEADASIKKLHKQYLAKLSKRLNADQVEQVKDGMTYRVVPITYNGYMQMLPNLTEEQKAKILAYLKEARELAMDAETSEKKHQWFGKYKGKINNYLSAAGYDMKKASDDWALRIKEEAAKKKN